MRAAPIGGALAAVGLVVVLTGGMEAGDRLAAVAAVGAVAVVVALLAIAGLRT
jgi:hypothetical protein